MSGYRRVNFYELCRLCTSSEGVKVHIFHEDGRRRQLPSKIQNCLPLQIQEEDTLPKVICSLCLDKLEEFMSFRQSVITAESMLKGYFTSLRYSDEYKRSDGKISNVYVKEIINIKQEQEEVVPKSAESVIHVLKTSENGTSTISVANNVSTPRASSITYVDQNAMKTVTLPINVSSPIKLTAINSNGNAMVLPVLVEGLQGLVSQGANVQLVQQADATGSDGSRVQSYKYVQIPNNQGAPTIAIVPSSDPRFNFVGGPEHTEVISVRPSSSPPMHEEEQTQQHHEQDLVQDDGGEGSMQHYVEFTDSHDRNNLSNISEFLKLKTMEPHPPTPQHQNELAGPETVAMCGSCCKILTTTEEMNHHVNNCTGQPQENPPPPTQAQTPQQITPIQNGVLVQSKQTTPIQNGVLVQSNNQNKEKKTVVKHHRVETDPLMTEPQNSSNAAPAVPAPVFDCDICGKTFKKREHLFQHKKLHTGERPFICGTCNKAFSRKEHLLRHGTSHTGQKIHPCDICGKTFSRKDNLHKHRKTHGISGPHMCKVCGKSFVVKHYYLMHIANHGCSDKEIGPSGGTDGDGGQELPQFRCDICYKAFVTEEYLKTHRSRHRQRKNMQVKIISNPNNVTNTNSEIIVYNKKPVKLTKKQLQLQQQTQQQIFIEQQPSSQEHQQFTEHFLSDSNQVHQVQTQEERPMRHHSTDSNGHPTEPMSTIILKQEPDLIEDQSEQEDIQDHHQQQQPQQPRHHQLTAVATSANHLIPTTLGTHVIQIPASYLTNNSNQVTLSSIDFRKLSEHHIVEQQQNKNERSL